MKNKYYTSARDSKKGVFFFKLNTTTNRMYANNLNWRADQKDDVLRVNECIPAMLGTILKYDWPTEAMPLLKEYFKDLADEIL